MPTGELIRKRTDRNCRYNKPIQKRRKKFCASSENKENSLNFINCNTRNTAEVQYLFKRTSTMIQTTKKRDFNRLEGGGGVQHEIYYDCFPCESESDKSSSMLQQQLQICEVIREIKNPREFKGLLRQMAYTANALYRTFRQAYCKTKKCKQQKEIKKLYKKSDMATVMSGEIIDVEVPFMRQEEESLSKEQQANEKSPSEKESFKQPDCCACNQFTNKLKEKICSICFGYLEDETDLCWAAQDKTECLTQTPICLEETKCCGQYEEELKHLDFCDRCAVLRGEMIKPSREQEEPQVLENSHTPTATKQVLNLTPVCVNIPLKLQIHGENCQKRFLQTEIQMETFCDIPVKAPDDKSAKVHKPPGSETFYSCISECDLIKSPETLEISKNAKENTLNEILDMMKKHMPSFKEDTKPKPSESKGIQISPPAIPASALRKPPSNRSDYTQTVELSQPIAKAAAQFGPEIKGNKLREELLTEVRAALEKTTTKEAIKGLKEGKRFSLPTYPRQTEVTKVRPARYSAPSAYQALPTSSAALRPLAPLPATLFAGLRPNTARKPELPPKPAIPPKPILFATGSAQTDESALKSSGHYRRSEIRNEIQHELKELLQEYPLETNNNSKYKPDERDEILLDLHKLFHPDKVEEQNARESVLEDIKYLLEPEVHAMETASSQDSALQSIKYILNPKATGKTNRKKKYPKDIKEKFLHDLQILVTPRSEQSPLNEEIRTRALEDLSSILNNDPTLGHPSPALDLGPGSSAAAQQLRQERQQRPAPNEIRDSVINDLKFLLDLTNSTQTRKSLEENLLAAQQAAKNVTITISSGEESSDNEKRR